MAFCASASAAWGRHRGGIANGHVPAFKKPLLTSEGELWRQRRIMAPAFHNKRIAEFVALIDSPIDQGVCRRLGG
jgi:cytochrome P450